MQTFVPMATNQYLQKTIFDFCLPGIRTQVLSDKTTYTNPTIKNIKK